MRYRTGGKLIYKKKFQDIGRPCLSFTTQISDNSKGDYATRVGDISIMLNSEDEPTVQITFDKNDMAKLIEWFVSNLQDGK